MIKLFKVFGGRAEFKELRKNYAELQHTVNILISGMEEKKLYKGNPYETYGLMVRALSKKYSGAADWGNQITKNIIDVRAAFTIGQGIKPVMKDKTKTREMDFIKQFIEFNNLDEEKPQDWAKEAEIEGKFLCRLFVNQDKRQIEARYIPWTAHEYKIETEQDDYEKYTKASYRVNKTGDTIELEPAQFIYKKFGGRTHKVNETPPKTGLILRQIEDLDKALWDWRKINHLFSAPTPYFKCETAEQAKKLNDLLKEINWKIGKLLVTTATYSLAGFSGQGTDSLEKEIVTLAKIISGATGVPVHFLGLPDLMSNRAVADNLMELLYASTSKERHIWIGAYEEIFQKVLTMATEELNGGYDPMAIGAEIPFVTTQKMTELVEVWLPIYSSGAIGLDFFLSKIPGLDIEEEKKKGEQSPLLEKLKEKEKKEKEKEE